MGPLEVVNVREYFEFAPGEYFAGPLIPVMWAVEIATQERRVATSAKRIVKKQDAMYAADQRNTFHCCFYMLPPRSMKWIESGRSALGADDGEYAVCGQ
jgi:hypothetical protein